MPSHRPARGLRRRALLSSLVAAACPPALPALLAACGGGGYSEPPPAAQPRFTHEGLDGRIVQRLRPAAGAGLLAATDDGLHQRRPDGSWAARGLAGEQVFDVTAVAPDVWLASVRSAAGGAGAVPRLVQTTDAGATWSVVNHDFGGPQGPEAIQALVFDGAGGRLLATGHDVLAVSFDMGRRWQRLAGTYHAFASPKSALGFDPVLGDVWYGGQDAIERLALFRWRQSDGSVTPHPELMPSPSTVKGIRFVQGQPARLLVAGEGGIVHSPDRGASWQVLLQSGHDFFFDVVQDPQRPQRWVTARWEKNFDAPQRLLVALSDDDGRTWTTLVHDDAQLFGGTWSLAAGVIDGRSVFHLGLYRGGVVRLELG